MACRNTCRRKTAETMFVGSTSVVKRNTESKKFAKRLLFGVDSKTRADDLLQNNIDEFEWIVKNKIYPNFYGRYISGEDRLSVEEIEYLHKKGVKIAPIYSDKSEKVTEAQGASIAIKVAACALQLDIHFRTVIFLEIDDSEPISTEFMRGFVKTLEKKGYTPGFKANTDARFAFDREFSRGMQTSKELFELCIIWAATPTIDEYNKITTSHLIHPDEWKPYAPSGITRREIAVWQYGKDCHPIEDDMGNITTFNLNLVFNEQVIIDMMY